MACDAREGTGGLPEFAIWQRLLKRRYGERAGCVP